MSDPSHPNTVFRPGDVYLTKGTSFVARLIRTFTTRFGESRSQVNHVGIVVTEGGVDRAVVVEALSKVKKHPMARYQNKTKTAVAVFRPLDLTPEQIGMVVAKALEYEGRSYGYGKIVAHFLDWVLQGAYLFRRLTSDDRYPICSWVVAYAFEKARPRFFGVDPGSADPDDIWDWIVDHPDLWEQVRALRPFTD